MSSTNRATAALAVTLPLSYTIWHTQRTGSTWLCEALTASGVAGRPGETLDVGEPATLFERHGVTGAAELIAAIRETGSTVNGVFGIKQGYTEPRFGRLLSMLNGGPLTDGTARLAVWERAFPDHRHLFMTRRNKVRLAVSWWRAIRSGRWHRRSGDDPLPTNDADGYRFDAIDRLLAESVMREAGIQSLFEEAGVVPLTVVYEDMLADPRGTLRRVLAFLGLEADADGLVDSELRPTADELSEAWVARYRREKQSEWETKGW